jgi:hypothetical protein
MVFFEIDQDSFEFLVDVPFTATVSLFVKQFVADIADYALHSAQKHIPKGETLRSLEALEVLGPERGATKGSWVANVGLGEVESLGDEHESPIYPVFVHEGTGLFANQETYEGRYGGGESGLIRPANGNIMVFEKEGEGSVFTRHVEGQLPQPWSEDVHRETDEYVRLRKRVLAGKIQALFK